MSNPIQNQISANFQALRGGGYETKTPGLFSLSTTAYLIPHPQKASKGGEDALMISRDGNVVGVADGVGGWAERGVNPSLYSSQLMGFAKLSSDLHDDNPLTIMEKAYQQTTAIGSSTCCLLSLNGCHLKSANLGDSGFAVIRRGRMIFKSTPQQRSFNFPYQLGTHSHDRPTHSDINTLKVTEGDLIVLASDGFWDNVWTQPENPESFVHLIKGKTDEQEIAKILARTAFKITRSKKPVRTPFSAHERKAYAKLDDITIAVSRVTSKTTKVVVRSLPEASHELNAVPLSSSSSTRSKAKTTTNVSSRGLQRGSSAKAQPKTTTSRAKSSSFAPVKRWRI